MVSILLLFISAFLNAQFYEYGQDAGSLKWYQFNTPNYKVIHPKGLDSLAMAFAQRLEYYYPFLAAPLDHKHSPMPVVVHNESSFSNGVFVWAPRRLEIFTNPDPKGYHMDWLSELALHEGRHAVQIDKLNQGLTKGLSVLGGEQVVGAIAGYLPAWYLEGDAVDAETRLSETGRGRQPSFEMELKAQMLELNRQYSFSKATLGSYKDYVPNHYRLGYLMVRYGRRNFGDQIWIDFQQYVARKPYLLNPGYFSLKNYGISSKKQLYKDALDHYKAHWTAMASERVLTSHHNWNNEVSKHYTSYQYPHFVSNSLIFAYKSGIDQIPEFVLLGKGGQEKRVFRPGFLNSGRVSFSGSYAVWDEFVPDLRWSNRNYSVIKTFEMATGRSRSLGHKTRYYSPDISADGSRIAAVEQTALQKFNLVILDIDGTLLEKIPSPDNRFIQYPTWMEPDSSLLVILSDAKGKSLFRYHTPSRKWNNLFEAGFDDISLPAVLNENIYFSGTFSGIDNIFCYKIGEDKVYQLTSSSYGAFQPQPSADGKGIVFSNYTSFGFRIESMALEEGLWKPLEEAKDHTEQLDYDRSQDEMEVLNGDISKDSLQYTSKRYYKPLHLFNVHSWLPLYFDYLNPEFNLNPEQLPVSAGFSLVSQDRLSTAVSQVGYEYKDGNHMFHSGIRLKGRYPVTGLFFEYGGDPNILLFAEGDSVLATPNDLRFTVQTYVPLRLNTGKFLSIVQPRIDYNYRRDIQYVETERNYKTGAHYLNYSLAATSYLRRGVRDILPRLGLSVSGAYYHAPFNHQVYGSVARAGLVGYIPGVLPHHSIRFQVQHQKQYPLSKTRPAFINLISMPRGIHGIFGEVLNRYGVDYVLPLAYPDLELTALAYIKRIRGAIWADHIVGTNVIIREPDPHYENRKYTTVGMDLVFDMNLLRLRFPLSLGGRFSYEPETGAVGLEWLYSIDIN